MQYVVQRGNQRTTDTYGRGGGRQSSFNLEEYLANKPDATTATEERDGQPSTAFLTNATRPIPGVGYLDRETVYARAQYFLERVIPTAERCNVQLACHLEDPPAPVLRGIEMWNYPVLEGCERFANLVDSPMCATRHLHGTPWRLHSACLLHHLMGASDCPIYRDD